MTLIILITIVGSVIDAIPLVAPMVIRIFVTRMLPIAQFTATCGRKLSFFFSFGYFLSLAILSRTPATLLVA